MHIRGEHDQTLPNFLLNSSTIYSIAFSISTFRLKRLIDFQKITYLREFLFPSYLPKRKWGIRAYNFCHCDFVNPS